MDQSISQVPAGRRGRPLLSDKGYAALKNRITHGDYATNKKLPVEKNL